MGTGKISRRTAGVPSRKANAKKMPAGKAAGKKTATSLKTKAASRRKAEALLAPRSKARISTASAARGKTARTLASAKTRPSASRTALFKRKSEVAAAKKIRHGKPSTVDKKINSFAALAFIAVLSAIIGSLIFLGAKREGELASLPALQAAPAPSAVPADKTAAEKTGGNEDALLEKAEGAGQNACKVRKFDGEAAIRGWYADEQEEDGGNVSISVPGDYLKALPAPLVENTQAAEEDEITLELVDAPTELVESLKAASSDKPHEFTIKGFAFSCDGEYLSSIKPASEAFKKS